MRRCIGGDPDGGGLYRPCQPRASRRTRLAREGLGGRRPTEHPFRRWRGGAAQDLALHRTSWRTRDDIVSVGGLIAATRPRHLHCGAPPSRGVPCTNQRYEFGKPIGGFHHDTNSRGDILNTALAQAPTRPGRIGMSATAPARACAEAEEDVHRSRAARRKLGAFGRAAPAETEAARRFRGARSPHRRACRCSAARIGGRGVSRNLCLCVCGISRAQPRMGWGAFLR